MKKLCVLIAVCAMSLMAMAQKSELVGTWQQLDANGNPTTQVKVFMPDGRLFGFYLNPADYNHYLLQGERQCAGYQIC